MRSTRGILLAVVLLAGGGPLSSLTLQSFEVTDTIGIRFSSVDDAAPPQVTHLLKGAVHLPLGEDLFLIPGISLWFGEYLFTGETAAPAEMEAPDASLLMIPGLSLELSYGLPLTRELSAGIRGGILLQFPFAVKGYGEDPSGSIMGYYYGGIRLLYLRIAPELVWRLSSFGLIAGPDIELPLFHAWDGEPLVHHLLVGLRLGLRFYM
ncbi:hypothetical protein Spith_0024 [Spirochaeta thermophila DSM 6578]|uniref:Outer membrane protein beta-barrel domain-containing protein n=1 Tax=Winmispira thermophila (strain ATCC 700085 / DSM 6578 / Z-1203) TaxID=869211 RepID=G0GBF2_WINT7|nr:hypothetical protein [Spirochaeta thermophila]AEJ60311.1 hypothetical protein Spith_0024 [Spirochaeta thermophila DSM 6578]